MTVDNQDCEWAELEKLCPIDGLSESFLMIGDVELYRFAWACMNVDSEKIEGLGSRMWDDSVLERLRNDGYSEFSCFSSVQWPDETVLLPQELIEKHRKGWDILESANKKGEFKEIYEEVMNKPLNQPIAGTFNQHNHKLEQTIALEWLRRQHGKIPSFSFGKSLMEFCEKDNLIEKAKRFANESSPDVIFNGLFFHYFAWLLVGENPWQIARIKCKDGSRCMMRLSSDCINTHGKISKLLLKAIAGKELEATNTVMGVMVKARALIKWLHGGHLENSGFAIPFPDWMEKYVEEEQTDFEANDEKMHHNQERTWVFMYGGRLMKDEKIKETSKFITVLNEQKGKIKKEMIEDMRLGKNGKGGDAKTIDKCFEKMLNTFVKKHKPKS